MDITPKKAIAGGSALAAGILGVSLLFGSFFTVDQKNADVVTHWHKFSYIAQPGLHMKIPFADDVIQYTTATQQVEIEKGTVNTFDNQKAFPTLLVQYDIPPDGIKIIFEKYPNYEQRIYSLASDIMKIQFGKYNVMDIPSKRDEIESSILGALSKEAKRLYGANITEVQIKDIGYTNAFEISIDNMTKAKAATQQAEQERQRSIIEAEQAVVVAKGNASAREAEAQGIANSTEIQAKAESDKVRLEGEAQADAIKAQTNALNASPQYANYIAAKNWNGQLPTSIGVGASTNSIPMVNLGSLGK